MLNLKKFKYLIFSVLILFWGLIFFGGCNNDKKRNLENSQDVSGEQTFQKMESTENISITTSDKYTVTLDKEFYKPSMRIAKNKEEYVSVQQLKNGNEKIDLSEPQKYTKEKL